MKKATKISKILPLIFVLGLITIASQAKPEATAYELSEMLDEIEFLTQRRQVIAENIANIDTPGYRAQDLARSSERTDFAGSESEFLQQPTSYLPDPRHMSVEVGGEALRYEIEGGEEKLNGNNVVLEKEMAKSNEISNRLDRISSIYNKTRGMLKQVASTK